MQNRAIRYLRKDKAIRIFERPLEADLKTLLSATLALSKSSIVKKHIRTTLEHLGQVPLRATA